MLDKAATILGNSYLEVSKAQPVCLKGASSSFRVFSPKA